MKRMFQSCSALALAVLLAGCCYKPCTYDPITGVMYGGGLEPCCCGPLDPFCLFCNGCEQPLYPSLWPGGCGGGWGCFRGWGANCCPGVVDCCQPAFSGGVYGGCPHPMLPSPTYGGVVPPGAMLDGGVMYGGPIVEGGTIHGGVLDGGTFIQPHGMIQTAPGPMSQPSTVPPKGSAAQPSSPPPAAPAEDQKSGAVVPWPMLPPSAQQQPAIAPARFQSGAGRFVPARR